MRKRTYARFASEEMNSFHKCTRKKNNKINKLSKEMNLLRQRIMKWIKKKMAFH